MGKSHGARLGNPLQYSCLENPMDRGAWWAMVRGVLKSRTWLKWLSMHVPMMIIDVGYLSIYLLGTCCLLWRNVYSSFLPILKSGCLFCCCYCWILGVLHIFWVIITYQTYSYKYLLSLIILYDKIFNPCWNSDTTDN